VEFHRTTFTALVFKLEIRINNKSHISFDIRNDYDKIKKTNIIVIGFRVTYIIIFRFKLIRSVHIESRTRSVHNGWKNNVPKTYDVDLNP